MSWANPVLRTRRHTFRPGETVRVLRDLHVPDEFYAGMAFSARLLADCTVVLHARTLWDDGVYAWSVKGYPGILLLEDWFTVIPTVKSVAVSIAA